MPESSIAMGATLSLPAHSPDHVCEDLKKALCRRPRSTMAVVGLAVISRAALWAYMARSLHPLMILTGVCETILTGVLATQLWTGVPLCPLPVLLVQPSLMPFWVSPPMSIGMYTGTWPRRGFPTYIGSATFYPLPWDAFDLHWLLGSIVLLADK